MRAYGYTSGDSGIVPEEAEILREIAGRVVLDEPLLSIVRSLNERGITTSFGRSWDSVTIRALLTNPRIMGTPRNNRPGVPAIITAEMFEKIAQRFNRPERRIFRANAERPYLLAGGWLHCDRCDAKMVPKGGTPVSYICSERAPMRGCGRMRISAAEAETCVAARILGYIADPGNRVAIAEAAGFTHGGPARIEYLTAQLHSATEDGNEEKCEALAHQLSVATAEWEPIRKWASWFTKPENLTPAKLAAWWEKATLERRQDLMLCLIQYIKVKPVGRIGRYANGEVADRLDFVWKI